MSVKILISQLICRYLNVCVSYFKICAFFEIRWMKKNYKSRKWAMVRKSLGNPALNEDDPDRRVQFCTWHNVQKMQGFHTKSYGAGLL